MFVVHREVSATIAARHLLTPPVPNVMKAMTAHLLLSTRPTYGLTAVGIANKCALKAHSNDPYSLRPSSARIAVIFSHLSFLCHLSGDTNTESSYFAEGNTCQEKHPGIKLEHCGELSDRVKSECIIEDVDKAKTELSASVLRCKLCNLVSADCNCWLNHEAQSQCEDNSSVIGTHRLQVAPSTHQHRPHEGLDLRNPCGIRGRLLTRIMAAAYLVRPGIGDHVYQNLVRRYRVCADVARRHIEPFL
ncbi:hypothetical protein PR048_032153 [Dryococelus australis]|uniref:Uncharacterized protein n=1 Tax=Dryococelus australis TaxID=614101 RepID=A0ABQ9G1F4_9NEOP|nr:hypothetical protein PR048_032153 [Dryococelus australis]